MLSPISLRISFALGGEVGFTKLQPVNKAAREDDNNPTSSVRSLVFKSCVNSYMLAVRVFNSISTEYASDVYLMASPLNFYSNSHNADRPERFYIA
jgi:hypothetical protein